MPAVTARAKPIMSDRASGAWYPRCIGPRSMIHSCHYLCSELVTVRYEEQPGDIRQAVANLEEISSDCAVVLLEEEPALGASISLEFHGRDLFGTISGRFQDTCLGWFARVAFEEGQCWDPKRAAPKHLLAICDCSWKGASEPKVGTLENSRNTEENVPVKSLA